MKFKLVGIGEVLWDLLPSGRQMGGAPANFAYHATALGADARLISRVGNDAPGRDLVANLGRLGVPIECIEVDPVAPTGTVTVQVAANGEPQFTIHKNVAWDSIHGESAGRVACSTADAVCFGTLAQRSERSRMSIRALVRATSATAVRVLDVNLRQDYFSAAVIDESLVLANVLKVNDAELPRLAKMLNLRGDERAQIGELADRYNLRLVAFTRGERGGLLFSNGEWSDRPGLATTVVDTIGAGDAFTASMTLGLLAGWNLARINEHANKIAAFVCSRAGATPLLLEELGGPFQSINSSVLESEKRL